MSAPIVAVGAGHGGFHLALAYRDLGGTAPIVLVDGHPGLPIQRPPLSKAVLAPGDAGEDGGSARLEFRSADFYANRDIELRHQRVRRIDRGAQRVVFDDGEELAYEHLVLSTGARNRRPELPGMGLDGVFELRTPEDAARLRPALTRDVDVVVIGGGFIGLEVAAAAAKHGRRVTVLEAGDRVMARVVSPTISEHFQDLHARHGVTIRTGVLASAFLGDRRVGEVELSDGTRLPAGIVVLGIGVVPEDVLAREAGLPVCNGIEVDDLLLTADPAISAIGDCASFPTGEGRRRLESVQNAADQARAVAARLTGSARPYAAVPRFWSEQHGTKIQIAGVATGAEEQVVRVDAPQHRFADAGSMTTMIERSRDVTSPSAQGSDGQEDALEAAVAISAAAAIGLGWGVLSIGARHWQLTSITAVTDTWWSWGLLLLVSALLSRRLLTNAAAALASGMTAVASYYLLKACWAVGYPSRDRGFDVYLQSESWLQWSLVVAAAALPAACLGVGLRLLLRSVLGAEIRAGGNDVSRNAAVPR